MTNFNRTTKIATITNQYPDPSRKYPVFITVKWNDNNLSVTGVEGPLGNGDCKGSCGQIDMHEWNDYIPEPGIDLQKIREYWNEWHRNDMTAGSPKQHEAVKEYLKEGTEYDYKEVCEHLKSIGLYEDESYIHNGKPYKYGSAWLRREVPLEVVKFFL